jgi:hypothetical protein
LVHRGRQYDFMAIVGIAHKVSNGRVLAPAHFSATQPGARTAVWPVRPVASTSPRRTAATGPTTSNATTACRSMPRVR